MKKRNLFTTSMATAVLVASVTAPVAGAQSTDEIKNYYQTTGTTNSVTNLPTPTQSPTNTTVDIQTLRNLLDQLEKSNNIYDSSKALQETVTVNQVVAKQAEVYTPDFVSNTDSVRRTALEKVFGISLNDIDTWDNSEGRESPNGSIYTAVTKLKEQAIYASNANRQELIRYAMKSKDWQPYYWFEAMEKPSHYEIVNGKVVHNKNYYAYMSDSMLNNLRVMVIYETDQARKEELQKIYESQIKEMVKGYNDAPGMAVYSVMLHHHLKDRTDLGIKGYDNAYFNSKWNKPEVNAGKSIDGTNPFRDIVKSLQDGSLIGSISEGYKKPETTQPTQPSQTTDNKGTTTETKTTTDSSKSVSNVETQSVAMNAEQVEVEEQGGETEEKPSFLERIVLKVKKVASLD